MKLLIFSLAFTLSCSKSGFLNRKTDRVPPPEVVPASPPQEEGKPGGVQTTSDSQSKTEEPKNSEGKFDFVSDRFENYTYQVPQIFLQYSAAVDEEGLVTSRTYGLPPQVLPNSIDNGISLTVGKVKCESRDSYSSRHK